MKDIINTIKEYLSDNGYHLLEDDPDTPNVVRIRYQLKTLHILVDEDDATFFSIINPDVVSYDDETEEKMLRSCVEFARRQKVTRAFPYGDGDVAVSYEFFSNNEEDVFFQLKTGLDNVSSGSRIFRRLFWD